MKTNKTLTQFVNEQKFAAIPHEHGSEEWVNEANNIAQVIKPRDKYDMWLAQYDFDNLPVTTMSLSGALLDSDYKKYKDIKSLGRVAFDDVKVAYEKEFGIVLTEATMTKIAKNPSAYYSVGEQNVVWDAILILFGAKVADQLGGGNIDFWSQVDEGEPIISYAYGRHLHPWLKGTQLAKVCNDSKAVLTSLFAYDKMYGNVNGVNKIESDVIASCVKTSKIKPASSRYGYNADITIVFDLAKLQKVSENTGIDYLGYAEALTDPDDDGKESEMLNVFQAKVSIA